MAEALDEVRPYMESHGGNVELVSASRTESSGCAWRAAATAARPPRRPSSSRSRRRSTRRRRTWSGLEVEGLEQDLLNPVKVTGTPLPMAGESGIANGGGKRPGARRARLARRSTGRSTGWPRISSCESTWAAPPIVVAKVEGSLLAFADPCPAAAARSPTRDLDEGMLPARAARKQLLPAAGRALARRREAPARPGSPARFGGSGSAGGVGAMSRNGRAIDDAVAARRRANMVTGLRGLRRGPESGPGLAPTAGGPDAAADESATSAGGAPVRARHLLAPRRAADPLRLRALRRAALRRPLPGPPAVAWSGWMASTCPTSSGRASRSRSGWPSSCTAARSTAWWRSTPARPAPPSPSWSSSPGRTCCAANPELEGLEQDAEALVVNRMAEPHQFVIAPIDECYRLVGAVKASWEGISGGAAIERASRPSSTRCGRARGRPR